MADTFNEQIGFLVLDDVVNSFDIEHRGRLAQLLTSAYDGTQVIVLTHDHQFYEQIAKQAPSWARLEFVGWRYQEGPRVKPVRGDPRLAAALERLEADDTTGAAQKARAALEALLQDACERLQAPLPFRRGIANDRRELGELIHGLRRVLKKDAKAWLEEIDPLLKQIEGDVTSILNVEAHVGGGRASKQEVTDALEHVAALQKTWICPDCETPMWHQGTAASARCKCGQTTYPPLIGPTQPGSTQ